MKDNRKNDVNICLNRLTKETCIYIFNSVRNIDSGGWQKCHLRLIYC